MRGPTCMQCFHMTGLLLEQGGRPEDLHGPFQFCYFVLYLDVQALLIITRNIQESYFSHMLHLQTLHSDSSTFNSAEVQNLLRVVFMLTQHTPNALIPKMAATQISQPIKYLNFLFTQKESFHSFFHTIYVKHKYYTMWRFLESQTYFLLGEKTELQYIKNIHKRKRFL